MSKGFLGQSTAPSEDPSAVAFSLFNCSFIGLNRGLVDDRSHPDIAFKRVANLDLSGFLHKFFDEPIADIGRDVHTRASGAFLALGAER